MARANAEIQLTELRGHPLKAIGDPNNLNQNLLGIMCSQSCPGDLVLKGFDAAKQIRDQGITVASGFHSSMEKDIFEILNRGDQPIVLCLARAIETYHLPQYLSPNVEKGQLTIIAPDFSKSKTRITQKSSDQRNAFLLDICNKVLIIHAIQEGNLYRTIIECEEVRSKIFAIESNNNKHLFDFGVQIWECFDKKNIQQTGFNSFP